MNYLGLVLSGLTIDTNVSITDPLHLGVFVGENVSQQTCL